jgi:integrase
VFVPDSGSRRFTLIAGSPDDGSEGDQAPTVEGLVEPGLADVVTLQRQTREASSRDDERALFQDTLAEYCWARDVAGLSPLTLETLVQPVVEICTFYGTVPWLLSPRKLDRYFAGPGKRGHATVRSKVTRIDRYFAFLEQRYAGEISSRFGVAVQSPVDPFNRPRHRGDFGLRIPPSQQEMKAFFASWREELSSTRKYPVAVRDYVMAKIAYVFGVRATELCQVRIGDVHWDNGHWGRFLVRWRDCSYSPTSVASPPAR